MEKKEMKHLKKLIAEKKDLESRLEKQQFKPKEELADTVKDYRTGYPKTIVIRGYGNQEWQRLRDVYYMKLGDICGRIQRMEDFLNSVEDAELREILRLRYQDGLSQEEIAERLHYSRSAIQKKEERFWKSV